MPRKSPPLHLVIASRIQVISDPNPAQIQDFRILTQTPISDWPPDIRASHWAWTGANTNPGGKCGSHQRVIVSRPRPRKGGLESFAKTRTYAYHHEYKRSRVPRVYDPAAKKNVPVRPIIHRMFQHLFVGEYDRPKLSLWFQPRLACELDLCVNPLHFELYHSEAKYRKFMLEVEAKAAAHLNAPVTAVIPAAGYNPETEDVIGSCLEWIMEKGYKTLEEALAKIEPILFTPSEIRLAFERM